MVSRIFCVLALCVAAASVMASSPGDDRPFTIEPMDNAAPYPGASIHIVSPKPDEVLLSDSVGVIVELSGFDVAVPTPGDAMKGIAYSKMDANMPNMPYGQHVHIIVDNEPYMACYVKGSTFWIPKKLTPGMHTLRVFPSRSWHESVKQPGCFAMETFYVKEKKGTPIDWTQPFLTYSRPKGEYSGDAAKKIMVDFYVTNCELGLEKYHVMIYVDDDQHGFPVSSWQPYTISGLKPGQHKISVQLLNPNLTFIPGAWNATTRTITVK